MLYGETVKDVYKERREKINYRQVVTVMLMTYFFMCKKIFIGRMFVDVSESEHDANNLIIIRTA